MGRWAFIKWRGRTLEGGISEESLRAELVRFGIDNVRIYIRVEGDVVHVEGEVKDQAAKEKIILVLGNVAGVGAVIDSIPSTCDPMFYTVVPGDTLPRIAKDRLGCNSRASDILAANRPLFTSAQQITPGQTLRLPQQ